MKLRSALTIAAAWTGLGFFLAAQRYLRGPSLEPRMTLSWRATLAASLITATLWAVLTPAAMRLARRYRPRRGTLRATLPRLVLASLGAALVHLTATNLIWQIADGADARPFVERFLATLAFGGAARLMTFAGILAATWALDDYRAYRRKALRSSELERDLVHAELDALERRLHPSFLFRSLDGLAPLIRSDPRAAAALVVQLGDLLRRTLHHDETGLVPLRVEIGSMSLYLEIERARIGPRLDVSSAVETSLLEAEVPHRILLPLIESAIVNGVAHRAGRRRIEVIAGEEAGALRVEVRERAIDAAGADVAREVDESFVETARRRLELLFPRRHSIALSVDADGHAIALTLPLSFAEPAAPRRGAA